MSGFPHDAPSAGGRPLAGLVAVLTLQSLELVRSSGPLLDQALTTGGVQRVAGVALLTYLCPGLVVAVVLIALRRSVRRWTPSMLLLTVGMLSVLRLLVQGLDGTPRVACGLAAVAVAIGALTVASALLASRPGGGRTAAGAVAVGAAAGVGLQLALGTWDALWRHTAIGWSVATAVAVSMIGLAAWAGRDAASAPTRPSGSVWALGLVLALAAMMLANPAFAASQSGLPLAVAGPVNAFGLFLAGWWVSSPSGPAASGGQFRRLLEMALLMVLVGFGLSLGGGVGGFDAPLVLLALLGAQVMAIGLLGHALVPGTATDPGAVQRPPVTWRLVVTASLVGAGTIVPLLVYQIDYDVPLGFLHELVLVATAAALGMAALRRPGAGDTDPRPGSPTPRGLLVVCGVVVLVGTGIAGAAWLANRHAGSAATGQPPAGTGRVVSWNLHYGVGPGGSVDLEATARTIEAQQADVVLLQEVSRGWVLGGGVDMATWLSHRLDRQFAFAPAADRRFGNEVLARGRMADVTVTPLPYGDGPQHRSALSAQVRLGNDTVRVTSVHLQQRRANTPTRLLQLEALLGDLEADQVSGAPLVIGGDFNAEPGSPEIAVLRRAGFVSAIDSVGDAAAFTSPTTAPVRRIDWVFGRGVGFTSARVLVDARTSDHLPLVVAIRP